MGIILLIILFLYILLEVCTWLVCGLNGVFPDSETKELMIELQSATLNQYTGRMLRFKGESEKELWFVAKCRTSILFPYYIRSSGWGSSWVVKRGSRSHKLIKEKFSQLKQQT